MDKLFSHGRIWTDNEKLKLQCLFNNKEHLRKICEKMGRTGTSITAQLAKMDLISRDSHNGDYRFPNGAIYCTANEIQIVNEYMAGAEPIPPAPVPQSGSDISAAKITDAKNRLLELKYEMPNFHKEIQMDQHINTTAAVCRVHVETGVQTLKTFVYIYGKPADDVSDAQIVTYIAKLEEQITSLKKIETSFKTLEHMIGEKRLEIKRLVDIVDNRRGSKLL